MRYRRLLLHLFGGRTEGSASSWIHKLLRGIKQNITLHRTTRGVAGMRIKRRRVGYFYLTEMKRLCTETDEWLRRRIRMCIWKSWKKSKTKVANLIRCGIDKYQAYQWGNTRKGYWRIADSVILKRAIPNISLKVAGYPCLTDLYFKWNPK